MKITVTTTETKEIEKEIELPYFFKHVYEHITPSYYAIFSEAKAMAITIDGSHVMCCSGNIMAEQMEHPRFAESTEAEFNEAFEATIEKLTSMIPQHA